MVRSPSKPLSDRVKLEGEAQPEVAVLERLVVVVPVRHTAAPTVMAITAATVHAERARSWTRRICLSDTRVTAPRILAPFIHIATHIKDAQFIGCLGGDRLYGSASTIPIPCDLVDVVAAGIFICLLYTSDAADE